jgi:hypothetical protein
MKFVIFLFGLGNATVVYFIRHAEKPKESSSELSHLGKKRASCLATIFSNNKYFHIPKRIIAQPSNANHPSKRPIGTVKPLAKKLGLGIEHGCDGSDIKCVQDLIKQGNGPILIAWEHKRLSKIIKKFIDQDTPKYPSDRYDLVWILDTKARTFTIQEQHCHSPKLNSISYSEYIPSTNSAPPKSFLMIPFFLYQ